MIFTMSPTQSVEFHVSPVDSKDNPNPAVLSDPVFTSFTPELLTAVKDPDDNLTGIAAGQGVSGSAILIATATATEADGTSKIVRGAVVIAL
jgi:hypothetical protein